MYISLLQFCFIIPQILSTLGALTSQPPLCLNPSSAPGQATLAMDFYEFVTL